MKTARQQKNINKPRFAACGKAARLLSISVRAAGRVPVSKSSSPVHLSAGRFFHGESSSGSQNNNTHLKRCEIFRGKVPRAKLKKQTHLEIQDAIAPNL
jgi:hypothetical protein